MSTELRAWLQRCPLVAILRGLTPDEAIGMGEALVGNGIPVLEVPLNSPEPIESIRRLAKHFGDRALVGAGTVTDPADVARVRDAIAAGTLSAFANDFRSRYAGGQGETE